MINDITPSDPISFTGKVLRDLASPIQNNNHHSHHSINTTPKQCYDTCTSPGTLRTTSTSRNRNRRNNNITTPQQSFHQLSPPLPNTQERNLIQKLNNEYKQSLIDQEIGTQARQESVRNIMIVTILLFAIYVMIGCFYYSVWNEESQWNIEDSLLFLIYTVTTVGYGNHDIPTSPNSRICTIIFILIGIALVTVFFSEIFQYIVIQAARAQILHDEESMTLRSLKAINSCNNDTSNGNDNDDVGGDEENQQQPYQNYYFIGLKKYYSSKGQKRRGFALRSVIFNTYSWFKNIVMYTKVGQCFIILLPFIMLLLVGSIVVGLIEGWSAIDSLYWAIVTLTTVGYGDLAPTRQGSIWFCIFYLPTATVFLSLFLSHVASLYIQLHISQVVRIEKRLRKKLDEDEDGNDCDELMILKKTWTEDTADASSYSSPEQVRGTADSSSSLSNFDKQHLSMRDLIKTAEKVEKKESIPQDAAPYSTAPLPLRARVQQRLAYIIFNEFCNEEPQVEVQGNIISLSFLTWKEVAEKWMIPKKAKSTFKAVSVNVVLAIGTKTLRKQGLSTLIELDLNEFHRLFNPFTVAMGSSDIMEAWMLSTNPLCRDNPVLHF